MFKFKLNNGKVIDATKKSVAINSKGLKDGVRITTCDVINSTTSITRFVTEELSSIITDAGEISIDTTKDMAELVNDIKQAFNAHNVPTQSESDENENGDVPSENPSTPATITITFDFDGGQIDGGYGSSEATVDYGTKGLPYKYLPHPTKENYELVGWEPDITNYELIKDITVKAIWEKQKTLKLIIDPDTITYGMSAASMSVTDENGDAVSFSELNITNDNEDLVSVNVETGEISALSIISGRATITVERDGVSDSAYINVVAPTEENL